jgi:hypothetical protein
MFALIHSPYLWVLLIAMYIVFMAAVDAMEAPTPQDSRRYRWWFRFLHIVAVNGSRAAAAKFPVLQAIQPEAAEPENKTVVP